MSNDLTELNNHLFAQLKRLDQAPLENEALQLEIERSKSITDVAKSIVENASLQLSAVKLKAEYTGLKQGEMPAMLEGSKK